MTPTPRRRMPTPPRKLAETATNTRRPISERPRSFRDDPQSAGRSTSFGSASRIRSPSKPAPAITAKCSPLSLPRSRVRRGPCRPIRTASGRSSGDAEVGRRGWRRRPAGSPWGARAGEGVRAALHDAVVAPDDSSAPCGPSSGLAAFGTPYQVGSSTPAPAGSARSSSRAAAEGLPAVGVDDDGAHPGGGHPLGAHRSARAHGRRCHPADQIRTRRLSPRCRRL